MTKKYCPPISVLPLLAALLFSGCGNEDSRETARSADTREVNPATATAPGEVLNALESLAAPIALYPDPLLAEILIAATYPLEIAKAARGLESGPEADAANGELPDASIQRLTRLPAVIIMMNEHPQWTEALGDAFLAQPDALLNAVQILRQRVLLSGYLKDSAAMKVLKTAAGGAAVNGGDAVSAPEQAGSAQIREWIYLQPGDKDKIRTPLYDSETVFAASLASQPAGVGNDSASEAAGSGAVYPADFYPAYFPASSETGENGATVLAFSAGGTVDNLLTWGTIAWSDTEGYRIWHRYGNLTACDNPDDCWLGSADNGYWYMDELIAAGGGEEELQARAGKPAIAWRHDPRRRRGLRYLPEAAQRLGDLGPPPLAGQRLSATLPPLQERGFGRFAGVQQTEDKDAENFPAAAALAQDEAYSALSGLADFKAGRSAELVRGREMPDKAKAAVPDGSPGVLRPASKPLGAPALQREEWQELQSQQQSRESALSSIFSAVWSNARLIALFSSRGALSRTDINLSERGAEGRGHPQQVREEAD